MTIERWQTFSLPQQLAHVGSEVTRARVWQEKNSQESSQLALERALNLTELTISDPRWQTGLRELTRLREIIRDQFNDKRDYEVDLPYLERYCSLSVLMCRS